MQFIKIILMLIGVAIIIAFTSFMGIFYNSFKNYSERSVGIDDNIAYDNKLFDNYRIELKKINKLYFESNDAYYFFEKALKEHIVEVCVDRYFKENNVTDVSGFRFPININERYISDNNLDGNFVSEKFSKSLRLLEREGYEWTDLQQTWKIDQKIDCNKSFIHNYESYLEKYKSFLTNDFEHKNIQWVNYLNNHTKALPK